MTASAADLAAQTTSNQTTSFHDTIYAWKYEFACNNIADLCVPDHEAMKIATIWRLRFAVFVANNVFMPKLNDEAPKAIYLLRPFWDKKVFLIPTNDFQLSDSALKKENRQLVIEEAHDG